MAAWAARWVSAPGLKGQVPNQAPPHTEPLTAPSAGPGGELTVSGCTTASTAVVIHGSYAAAAKKNHGRPVFQKRAPAGGADVFLYYWDERDGPTFHGWWLGPRVGADQVWAYCPNAAPAPPVTGWQVPYGGPVDAGLRVSAARPAPQTVPPPGSQGQAAPKPRTVPAEGAAFQQRRQQQQQQQHWQQQPQPQQRGRWVGGAGARPHAAGAAVWPQDSKPPQPGPAAQKEPAALVAPCLVQLAEDEAARLCAGGGRAVKRLAALTGCSIDAPSGWAQQAGALAMRLSGGAKQRRLAAAAVREAAAGLEAEDAVASASGALVLPHGLAHEGRREWLAWRLASLEGGCGAAPPEVTRGAVRVAPAGVPADGEGVGEGPWEPSLRAALEAAIEEAQALEEMTVEAESELAPEAADAEVAIAPLAAQHGLLVRLRERGEGPRLHVLGPPAAARDAAALLWARYAQGHATAAVLQAAGRVQTMEAPMAKDFERDLQGVEAECGVRVHQAETMLWVDGADADSVVRARATLREVLLFYLPDEFLQLRGLKAPLLERLRQDAPLRAIAASPGSAVSLEREGAEGTAWLCGPRREEARRRIDALARGE